MLRIAEYTRPYLTITADTPAELIAFRTAADRRGIYCRGEFDTERLRWVSHCNKAEVRGAAAIIESMNKSIERAARAADAAPWTARTIELAVSAVPTPTTIVQNGQTLQFSGYGRSWIYPDDGSGDSDLEGMEVRYAYYR